MLCRILIFTCRSDFFKLSCAKVQSFSYELIAWIQVYIPVLVLGETKFIFFLAPALCITCFVYFSYFIITVIIIVFFLFCSIKLSLLQLMNFLTFTLSSLPHPTVEGRRRGKWGIGCVMLSCWLELNDDALKYLTEKGLSLSIIVQP